MKAVVTDGPGRLRATEVPEPGAPEGGAVVRVLTCGFCGSDLGKVDDPATPPGRVLGHEVVGLLERPGAEPVRVALAHHVPCGACALCLHGHSSLCRQFVRYDLDPGGFSERLAVTQLHLADSVFALSDAVDDVTGTLLEPLSCVLRALDVAAGLRPAYPLPSVGAGREQRAFDRPRVLVAGCGSVGLLFLTLLAHPSSPVAPAELWYLERDPARGALAESLGARAVAPPGERPDSGEVGDVDLCFLTAPGALPAVLPHLALGAAMVVFAAPPEPQPVDLDLLYRREITLAGVRSGSPGHLRRALALLEEGSLTLDWCRPEVVDLGGLPDAVDRYRRGGVLKVVARP